MAIPLINAERFDIVDLWQQTDALAADLKDGVYIKEFWGFGSQIKANLGWDVTDEAQQLRFENAGLRGTEEEGRLLKEQIHNTMAAPRYIPMQNAEIMVHDDAPDQSPHPAQQRELAQRFLPLLSKIAVRASLIPNAAQPLLMAERDAASTRDEVIKLARINRALAHLLDYEIDGYDDIVIRAQNWSRDSSRPHTWM